MDRVYQANAIETPPSTTASSGSYPTAGNKAAGQLATVPGPYWFYSITEEIRNALIAAGVTPDAAKVNQLAEAMSKFLPLSGGTMTGKIVLADTTEEIIIQETNTDRTIIRGGDGFSGGASLYLSGKDNDSGGDFRLYANNGTTNIALTGNPNGPLTWDGKEVERVNSSGADYIRYESGLQICWGGFRASTTASNVTFPVAFASAPRVVASMAGYSISPGVPDVYETYMKVQSSSANGGNGSYIAIGKWK